ncbi:protein OSCP1 isoform X2 [Ursus maritimus]|uniref:Protein OSCP1 isoform X2 n=1 Tax=Ursus maritimus TaxID=29073 RepID=A0A384CCN4_URSMA|nr:protein OSCP1 isoform X2 [Ursus maritimus]
MEGVARMSWARPSPLPPAREGKPPREPRTHTTYRGGRCRRPNQCPLRAPPNKRPADWLLRPSAALPWQPGNRTRRPSIQASGSQSRGPSPAPPASDTMSVRTLPLLFLNLGGEMLYILDQRLRAQNIPGDKARKVLNDIISTMFNRKFMEELFKPQELYSKKALRTIYDRLAHASIMRLNQASMDKVYGGLPAGEFQLIRQTLLIFFQDLHIRVSIFLKDKVQNSNGRFVLPVSGPVPWGTEVPGLIRMFNDKGKEVKKVEFKHGGHYVTAPKEGSFELYGDRVLKLGTNMYSMNRPVETHMSGASKSLASRTQESIAPNPLAKEELNFLARLMGGMEIKKPSGPEPGFRLNLFTTDEEEEQAALTRPEELSYEVINIQATQDQQRNEELARIMGEFEVTDQPRQSASKGDDLLAMMDEL